MHLIALLILAQGASTVYCGEPQREGEVRIVITSIGQDSKPIASVATRVSIPADASAAEKAKLIGEAIEEELSHGDPGDSLDVAQAGPAVTVGGTHQGVQRAKVDVTKDGTAQACRITERRGQQGPPAIKGLPLASEWLTLELPTGVASGVAYEAGGPGYLLFEVHGVRVELATRWGEPHELLLARLAREFKRRAVPAALIAGRLHFLGADDVEWHANDSGIPWIEVRR